MPGSLFARLGVLQDLRIEAAVAVHRPWKIRIARASAPISSARSICGTSTFSAPSATRLMVAVMTASGRATEREMIRTPITTTTSARPPRPVRRKRQGAIDILPCRDDLLAALGIHLGKCFEILVEGGTHGAIGVIVAPFATRGSANLDAAANQFPAEVDELFDPLLEHGELLGIICLDDGFPVFDHSPDLSVELEQSVAVRFFTTAGLRRHIDAAGFHHDCIDQRIDTLDVERGAARSLDGFCEFRVPAAVVVGQHGDRRGQKRDQSENRVQLGWQSKAAT